MQTTSGPPRHSRLPATATQEGTKFSKRHRAGNTCAHTIVPAILAALLFVAIALVLIQFREIEKLLNDDYTPPPSPPTTARAEAYRRRPRPRRRR